MPSPAFLQRMESVLSARVEAKIERERPRFARLRRAGGIVGATFAVLMVLKAAGLAHDADAFAAAPGPDAGLRAHVAYWLVGADPFSLALASALRPAATAPIAAL